MPLQQLLGLETLSTAFFRTLEVFCAVVAFNVSFEVVLVKVASAVSANSCLVISLHCVALMNLSPMCNDVDHGDKNLGTNATSANDEV